jgi:hypothetical protein
VFSQTNCDLVAPLLVSVLIVATCGADKDAVLSGEDGDRLDSSDGGPSNDEKCSAVSITFNSLLAEMADLARLTHKPDPQFSVHLASSYDRSSITPVASSDAPTGWYANRDWGNYLRVEKNPGRTEYVMLDIDGPGAIMRICSATMGGTLRIYIDEAVQPALAADFTQLLSGKIPPFLPPFAGLTAVAGNFDLPIPYRKHVKVTLEGDGPAYFYQVEYREYVSDCVDVTSYRAADVDTSQLDSVRALLMNPSIPESGATIENATLTAQHPAMAMTASSIGEAILGFEMTFDTQDAATLRTSKLVLTFDGRQTVRTPLGDFFGAGPGLSPHATLPLEVRADGTAISRFVMPFRSSAVIALEPANSLSATIRVVHAPVPVDERTYYFGAHWVARGPISSRPYRDLTLAHLQGTGLYVGTFLSLGNSSEQWWGEGDEKIWVDGDAFPSLFGTGSEDYYGFGYCNPTVFNHPYHIQTFSPGGFGASRGLSSMARYHVFDAIPFDSQITFNMELWHWDPDAQVTYDTISYFYLDQNAVDLVPIPVDSDFRMSPLFH